MTKLRDQVENVLNEVRMLLLGGQVLLGFGYQICFEPMFERLPVAAQLTGVASLGILTAGMGWLIWPVAFDQIIEPGAQSRYFYDFTSRILDLAFLPFALALGLCFYPASVSLRLPHPTLTSLTASSLAVAFWYGGILVAGGESGHQESYRGAELQQSLANSDLSDRIKRVLTECRMALPGAQAFLGFQFAIIFSQGFGRLPRSSQLVHFGSLCSTTLSIVLLIAPAAYHRLAESGRDTENFLRVANRHILMGLFFLAPGMTGDLFVVMWKITERPKLSEGIAIAVFFALYGLWFGASAHKKRK